MTASLLDSPFLTGFAGKRDHSHGLPDLLFAWLVGGFGIAQLVGWSTWLPISAPLAVLIYNRTHKHLTETRLGSVVPRPEHQMAEFRKSWIYAGLGLLGVFAGLAVLFFGSERISGSDLPLAMAISVVLLVFGWMEKVPRYAVLATLLLLSVGLGILLGWPEGRALVGGAAPMVLVGTVLMVRFLRKHPVPKMPKNHDLA